MSVWNKRSRRAYLIFATHHIDLAKERSYALVLEPWQDQPRTLQNEGGNWKVKMSARVSKWMAQRSII